METTFKYIFFKKTIYVWTKKATKPTRSRNHRAELCFVQAKDKL